MRRLTSVGGFVLFAPAVAAFAAGEGWGVLRNELVWPYVAVMVGLTFLGEGLRSLHNRPSVGQLASHVGVAAIFVFSWSFFSYLDDGT